MCYGRLLEVDENLEHDCCPYKFHLHDEIFCMWEYNFYENKANTIECILLSSSAENVGCSPLPPLRMTLISVLFAWRDHVL